MNNKKVKNNLMKISALVDETLSLLNSKQVKPTSARETVSKPAKPESSLDYSINQRAFFKAAKAAKLSGAKRFTLVLAYLAKGSTKQTIAFSEIEKCWNKNSGLLNGKLDTRTYATRAKENGWVDSPKNGQYRLASGWTAITS